MQPRPVYRLLAVVCLGLAVALSALAAVAAILGQILPTAAAALCAAVFVVPGFLFLDRARRMYLREVALRHAGALAESKGIIDPASLGRELGVTEADARKILRKAVREGHARGSFDARGRFVAEGAATCPACGAVQPADPGRTYCTACGKPLGGG